MVKFADSTDDSNSEGSNARCGCRARDFDPCFTGTGSMVATFQVQQDLFSGPIDLLLYLVRKHEIDSLELQLGSITRDYLEFIEVLEWIDIDLAGDFLVAASSLIEIKSRLALPGDDEPELEISTEQPTSQLIHQLLEYRRFKEASIALEEHASVWQERYPRLSDDRPRQGKDPRQDRIKEVELWDLVSAFSRVVRKHSREEQSPIRYDETPIGVYANRIKARLLVEERVAFSEFFEGEHLRSRIVGIFLAILELLRHHQFRAEQQIPHGEIWVMPPLTGLEGIEDLALESEFDPESDPPEQPQMTPEGM